MEDDIAHGSCETGLFCGKRGRKGSALMVALWVIGLLSLLVGSFSFDAHLEARVTSYYRKRLKATYLARSGIEVAELLMRESQKMKSRKTVEEIVDDNEEWWVAAARKMSEGSPVRGLEHPLGDGIILLDIVPEPARRNVNRLGEEDWERLFEVCGIPEELWPELIESFQDWIDKDNEPRFDGAETEDYYALLEDPYRVRNGPLDTVEELLLVKGFSRAILFGGSVVLGPEEFPVEVRGIAPFLTVYGDGKLNVNAASKDVLMTLPGVDDLVAGAIVEEREGWRNPEGLQKNMPYSSVNDLFTRIPELDEALKKNVTTDSQIYRVSSIGSVQNVKEIINCIVKFAGNRMTVLRWWEES